MPRRRRGRRWLIRALWALLGTVALFALGAGWLVGTDSGRAALWRFAAEKVLGASGWAVTADRLDLDLDLDGGRVVLHAIAAGTPASPPFARAARIEAEVLWRLLLADGVRIERIDVTDAIIDLAAPIPRPPETEPSGEPTPFDLAEVRVTGSKVVNGPAGGWLDAWTLDGIDLRASIANDGLAAAVGAATLVLDRRADAPGGSDTPTAVDPLSLAIAGRVRGPLAGPFTVDDLAVDGPGVALTGSATVGTGEDDPIDLAFVVDAEPGTLAPELAAGSGRVHAQGDLDLRRLTGTVQLDADGFPPEILEPVLGAERLDLLDARGTRLDAVADLRLDGADADALGGTANLTWRRGDARLLLADAEATPDADGIALRVDARLLPDAPGTRRLSGRLRAATWTTLADAPVEDGRLRVAIPDLVAERRRFDRLWPAMAKRLDQALGELALTGRLDIDTRVDGALGDPRLDGSATWRPNDGSSLRLTAAGRPIAIEGSAEIALDGIDLALLDPLVAGLAGSIDGTVTAEATSARTDVEGRLTASSWRVGDGLAATISTVEVDARIVDGTAEGRLDLRAERLDLGEGTTAETVVARAEIETLDLDRPLDGARWRLDSTIDAITVEGQPGPIRDVRAELSADGATFDSIVLDGQLETSSDEGPPRVLPISVRGDAVLASTPDGPAIERAALDAEVGRAIEGVDRLRGRVVFDAGVLRLELTEFVAAGRRHTDAASAVLPLATLARLPAVGAAVEALPVTRRATGSLDIAFDLPPLATETWARWFEVEPPDWSARAAISGALTLDPDAPAMATGGLVLRDVEVKTHEATARALDALRLDLGEGRVRLRRAVWNAEEHLLDVEGEAALDATWRFDDPLLDLVRDLRLSADGALPASLAIPFLAGGTAEGVLRVDAVISGTPARLDADVRVDGGEAAFTWLAPYFTRIEAPRAEIRLADGRLHVDRLEALWNGGDLELDGTVDGLDQVDLQGYYDSVRYRLDYGLSVQVSGNLAYRAEPGEPATIEANVLVDRGSLRRDLAAGRELLDKLLAPPEIELPPLADDLAKTRLAVRVATVDGVRVKNNLADLRVSWSPPLVVEGTLGAPRVFGEVVAEPGGRLYAYGQVVRLDHAVMRFSGDPQVGSTLDVEVTTSLEDPSIATPEDQQVLADLAQRDRTTGDSPAEDQIADSLAAGLTTYYGDQMAARLGQALGRTTIRYRPLWIFGESDPEARLVVSQDLSKNVSIGVAFDLTDSEQEIYLLDIHDLTGLPRLSATVFTSADSDVGGTVQQRIVFGGGDRVEEGALRLAEVRWTCPSCDSTLDEALPKRAMRRSLDLEEGEAIPDGFDFDAEIEIGDVLRREGWPDPEVQARLAAEADGERADLVVAVEPGPRASFRFTGEEPPKRRRGSIRELYRADVTEPASLEEMREQTLRVWRSLGHPAAEVEVSVDRREPDDPRADRVVTIHSVPGETVELGPPAFEGVPDDVATRLASRFASVQSRVELATGTGGAAERVVDGLRRLGYPDAEVVDQRLDLDAGRPVVRLEAGERRRLESISVDGAPPSEAEAIRKLVPLGAGDPLLSTELAGATLAIERHLRQRGWNRASVRVEVDGDGPRVEVEITIEPGPRHRLAAIEVVGETVTEPRWVERLSGLETGGWLDAQAISDARRRLLGTGLFDRVGVSVDDTEADVPEADATVRFDLVERPRYQFSYGARWESDDGLGAVIDLFDRNVGGRGIGLGARALWVRDETALRLYSNLPRLFNSPLSLDLFVEVFEETDDFLASEGWLTSAQLSWPLRPDTRLRTYVRYQRADVVDTRLPVDEQESQRESTPVVGVQIFHDGRDDPLDPRRGFFASFDVSGSQEMFSGGESYLRAFGQVDLHLQVPGTRGRLTWSQAINVGVAEVYAGTLPRDERFFAGGSRSVRGYDSRSLGPQEVLDSDALRALGGEASVVINQELRYDFGAALVGVAFFDAGQVWADRDDLGFDLGTDLLRSVGLGVRYRSPVGLLRLDLAHALDRREQDNEIEVYLGFGHAF